MQGGVVVVVVAAMFEMFVRFFWGMVDPHPLRLYPCFLSGGRVNVMRLTTYVRDDTPSRFQRFKAPPEIPC